ncbi:hypothetical protein HYV10_02130 [Candidatus Dependentiae bacterium]|nr:hypothetical protein [Candidatus Dependentiae bacterium]
MNKIFFIYLVSNFVIVFSADHLGEDENIIAAQKRLKEIAKYERILLLEKGKQRRIKISRARDEKNFELGNFVSRSLEVAYLRRVSKG